MPPKATAHPKYEDMVKAAILALKDRNGSSVPAIAKYLAANYKLPDNFKTSGRRRATRRSGHHLTRIGPRASRV